MTVYVDFSGYDKDQLVGMRLDGSPQYFYKIRRWAEDYAERCIDSDCEEIQMILEDVTVFYSEKEGWGWRT